ncbi:unnamed protein product, partial [Discosporangium mesarthrocarpum]
MAGELVCTLSADDVPSLTVAKLKVELGRLGQPLNNLKRKADYVEALTAYIERQEAAQKEKDSEQKPVSQEAPPPEPVPDSGLVTDTGDKSTGESRSAGKAGADANAPGSERPGKGRSQPSPQPESVAIGGEEEDSPMATGGSEPRQEPPRPASAPMDVDGREDKSDIREDMTGGGEPVAPASASAIEEEGKGAETLNPSPSKGRKRTQGRSTRGQEAGETPESKRPRGDQGKGRTVNSDALGGRKKGGMGDGGGEVLRTDREEAVSKEAKVTLVDKGRNEPDQRQSADNKEETDKPAKGARGSIRPTKHAPVPVKNSVPRSPARDTGTPEPTAAGVEGSSSGMVRREDAAGGGAVGAGVGEEEVGEVATVRIDNFVRPFTQAQAKKLLESKGGAQLVEGGFWMDSIKTHCYASFGSRAAADRAIAGLQGIQWPDRSTKRLTAKMADITAQEASAKAAAALKERRRKASGVVAKPATTATDGSNSKESGQPTKTAPELVPVPGAGGARPRPVRGANGTGTLAVGVSATAHPEGSGTLALGGGALPPKKGEDRKEKEKGEEEEPPLSLDEIFRKTKAVPSLYWLPLSEEEVGARKKKMEESGSGPRTVPMPAEDVAGGAGRNGFR